MFYKASKICINSSSLNEDRPGRHRMLPLFASHIIWLFFLLLLLLFFWIIPLCSIGFLVHVEVSPVSSVTGDHPSQKKGQKSESFSWFAFHAGSRHVYSCHLDKHSNSLYLSYKPLCTIWTCK